MTVYYCDVILISILYCSGIIRRQIMLREDSLSLASFAQGRNFTENEKETQTFLGEEQLND